MGFFKKALLPYAFWLVVFILVPLVLIVVYAFTLTSDAGIAFSLDNIIKTFDPIYLSVLWRSILLSLISTGICLIIGYPLAYIMANTIKRKNLAIMLIMIPMWMNFLLRTYAWLAILDVNGILNSLLELIGLAPVNILYTSSAIVLGMVYNFLPFMVLPIYSALLKMPTSYIEAAKDLGANKFQVFLKVVFPLSFKGVLSGITMVFMPGITTFAISRLLGGSKVMLMGDLIENQFMLVRDWNFGSALSFIMLIILIISMGIIRRDVNGEGGELF